MQFITRFLVGYLMELRACITNSKFTCQVHGISMLYYASHVPDNILITARAML
jgi:hypothetical protein